MNLARETIELALPAQCCAKKPEAGALKVMPRHSCLAMIEKVK